MCTGGIKISLIVPGVEIQVIKDLVPQQLNPSGVVGLIGTTEKGDAFVPVTLGSYAEFTDQFGANPRYTMTREAKMAFHGGVFQVVAVPVRGKDAKNATVALMDTDGAEAVRLVSRIAGCGGNGLAVKVEKNVRSESMDVLISDGASVEVYGETTLEPAGNAYLVDLINKGSRLVRAERLDGDVQQTGAILAEVSGKLSGGVDAEATRGDYEKALEALERMPDVDLVAVCDSADPEIHALVEAHCAKMSVNAKNRIGLGTVGKNESVKDISARTMSLASDRFVLVAPYGCLGAVAGLISGLKYYESPTFKAIKGVTKLERNFSPTEQAELLKCGIMPLEEQKGRGIVILKGISTSKEQISVTRIADHAMRSIKEVSNIFVGTLNNEASRNALKGRIDELMSRMVAENALVPSTDGTQPPYIINVYSSQFDFAQGIVRIDVAVRPARAMDYIYGTLRVMA